MVFHLSLTIGDIAIYSVFHDSPFNGSSSIGKKSHSEPIVQLLWKKSLINSNFELFSLSNDGKVLVWNDAFNGPISEPLRGYFCLLK